MGNTASNYRGENLHSKSIPNIRSLTDESEQFYFAQALKLQEQILFEKNLLHRKQQHQDQHCHQPYQQFYEKNSSLLIDELDFKSQNRRKNPAYRYSLNNPVIQNQIYIQQYQYDPGLSTNPEKLLYKPKTKKLNKFFNKIGSDKQELTNEDSLNASRDIRVESGDNKRTFVGTRLSCTDSFKPMEDKGLRPMYSCVNVPCVLADEKCLLGKT